MNAHWNSYLNRRLSRRELLQVSSTGFGSVALAAMLSDEARAATVGPGASSPLAVKPPHFPAKAKRVIFLFMHGGPSQVDTFDYKPLLKRDHGKPLPFKRPKVVSRTRSASSSRCGDRTPGTVGRCWNCTRAATPLSAPAWDRGSPTD